MFKYKRIGLFVGHSKLKNGTYTSANKLINEYEYNKVLGAKIKALFDKEGQPCDLIICPEGKFTSNKDEDDYKLPIANSGKYDLIIELHLNAFNGTADGSEVLYISNAGQMVAQRVQDKLKTVFNNREIKKRDNLYMLTKTEPVSIMIESFFCDSKIDIDKANSLGYEGIAKLIVEGILGKDIALDNSKGQTQMSKINIDGKVYDVETVIINDSTFVKLRDFSKAGYLVSYNQIPHIAKPK